jgi:hypothetical protein
MTCTPADRLRWVADFLEIAGKSVSIIACVEGIEYSDDIHREAQRDLRAIAEQLDARVMDGLANEENPRPQGNGLEIRMHRHTSLVVICLNGLLDCSTRAALLSTFDELLENGDRNFVVDAAEARITDASGIGALVLCQHRARESGGVMLWDELYLERSFGNSIGEVEGPL